MFVRSLSIGVAAAALMTSGAFAADLIIPTTPAPIMESSGFSWDGLYAGVEAGGFFNGDGVQQFPANDTYGVIGGVVGVNFTVAAPLVVGAEVQADYVFRNGASSAGLFLALAHVGAVVTDQVLVYAAGGVGAVSKNNSTDSVYALGAGVDVAVTDSISVRAEVLGLGDFGGNDDFFESTKATVGVFYHF